LQFLELEHTLPAHLFLEECYDWLAASLEGLYVTTQYFFSDIFSDWRKRETRFSHTHVSIEINITTFAVSFAALGDICQVWRHLKQGLEPIEA
jgi:hypothetical protein